MKNPFGRPWRYDTYKAAMGHTVHQVVSYENKQIFAGEKEECEQIIAATTQSDEEIYNHVESRYQKSLEYHKEATNSLRKFMHEEIGKLTEACHHYQEKIKELEEKQNKS